MKKLDAIKVKLLSSIEKELDTILEEILKEAYNEGFNNAMEYYIENEEINIVQSYKFDEFINTEIQEGEL